MPTRPDQAPPAANPPEMLGVNAADNDGNSTDREIMWTELGAEEDRLFELDCALQRIRDGVYGICEETGCQIPPERLRAIPWTRYAGTAKT